MKKKLFLAILFLILFLINTYLVLTNKLIGFDNAIYKILTSNNSQILTNYFKLFTKLGNSMTIIIIMCCFLVILDAKNRVKLASILFSTAGLNKLIKIIIKRPRPSHLHLIVAKGFSYPSGHAMGSMSLYGFLLYLVYKKIKNKYLKVFLITILIYIIITIGLSRIYLGVHYASDVIGGYLLSLSIILMLEIICDKLKIKEQ